MNYYSYAKFSLRTFYLYFYILLIFSDFVYFLTLSFLCVEFYFILFFSFSDLISVYFVLKMWLLLCIFVISLCKVIKMWFFVIFMFWRTFFTGWNFQNFCVAYFYHRCLAMILFAKTLIFDLYNYFYFLLF